VEATLARIERQPGAFPVVHGNTHRALVRRFPFGIFYVVRDADVAITAIMHCSRHPRRWRTRR
jgi:plasmid stabilization system protein ParE